ncbi:sigma factor-like helix-turn-helix DNA-binding protein [Streptomyces sp. NPDC008141]|uniref:sigma factor-like helix-turn-helix DNA-binding protein n=1 Tax=Streptomyces sp. NPDC008141 TaxID=3364815 RepID=UPI0036E6C52D
MSTASRWRRRGCLQTLLRDERHRRPRVEEAIRTAQQAGYPTGSGRLFCPRQVRNQRALAPFLPQLDQRERAITEMRYGQEFTPARIGEELGTSQRHVSRLLARAVANSAPACPPHEIPTLAQTESGDNSRPRATRGGRSAPRRGPHLLDRTWMESPCWMVASVALWCSVSCGGLGRRTLRSAGTAR